MFEELQQSFSCSNSQGRNTWTYFWGVIFDETVRLVVNNFPERPINKQTQDNYTASDFMHLENERDTPVTITLNAVQ